MTRARQPDIQEISLPAEVWDRAAGLVREGNALHARAGELINGAILAKGFKVDGSDGFRLESDIDARRVVRSRATVPAATSRVARRDFPDHWLKPGEKPGRTLKAV